MPTTTLATSGRRADGGGQLRRAPRRRPARPAWPGCAARAGAALPASSAAQPRQPPPGAGSPMPTVIESPSAANRVMPPPLGRDLGRACPSARLPRAAARKPAHGRGPVVPLRAGPGRGPPGRSGRAQHGPHARRRGPRPPRWPRPRPPPRAARTPRSPPPGSRRPAPPARPARRFPPARARWPRRRWPAARPGRRGPGRKPAKVTGSPARAARRTRRDRSGPSPATTSRTGRPVGAQRGQRGQRALRLLLRRQPAAVHQQRSGPAPTYRRPGPAPAVRAERGQVHAERNADHVARADPLELGRRPGGGADDPLVGPGGAPVEPVGDGRGTAPISAGPVPAGSASAAR